MPSEQRLHPLSFLFNLGKQAKGLVIPALLLVAGAGSAGMGWELLGAVLLVPYAAVALGRYLTYRYRYDPSEMVIRSGFLFRNERHVPYARIQNIEAVQNVLHRLFGVVEVRVQTGSGDEPEATMTVLDVAALDEMRRRVFEGRAGSLPAVAEAAAAGSAFRTVLALPVREVLLCGFIENRGLLVIAAAMGVLWQVDTLSDSMARVLGEWFSAGWLAAAFRPTMPAGRITAIQVAVALAVLLVAVAALLLFTRILSMGWALLRLHGFTATRTHEDEVRVEFGLLTRQTSTIPIKRIQQLTIRETPLHRLFDRASVRVTTAGGAGKGAAAKQREWLAPIIRRTDLPHFLDEVLPGVAVLGFDWHGVHPGAFSRAVKRSAFAAVLASVALTGFLRWYTLLLLPVFLALAVAQARRFVAHLGWARTENAVGCRRGAFWRYVTVARFSKIQAVALHESPFDRRHGMARVLVDTAGSGELHRVEIPYLDRAVARGLLDDLATRAAQSRFRW